MANSFPMLLLATSTLLLIFHFNGPITTATTVVSKDQTSRQMCVECENPRPPVQPPPLPPPPVVECPPPPLPSSPPPLPRPPPPLPQPPPPLPRPPPPLLQPPPPLPPPPAPTGPECPPPPVPQGPPLPPNIPPNGPPLYPVVPCLPYCYYPPSNSFQLIPQSTAFTFSFLILAFLLFFL